MDVKTVLNHLLNKYNTLKCTVKRTDGRIETHWSICPKNADDTTIGKEIDSDSGLVVCSNGLLEKKVCILDLLYINKHRMKYDNNTDAPYEITPRGQILIGKSEDNLDDIFWDNN